MAKLARTLNRRQLTILGSALIATLGLDACGPRLRAASLIDASESAGTLSAGTPDWMLSANRQTIKGFADKVSTAEGETVSLFVTTPARSFDVLVFRLGWYSGGARAADLVDEIRNATGIVQPAPRVDAQTGLISAEHWTRNAALRVSGWRTGLYLLKLVASDGDQNYIPLVVRDDRGTHDLLFEHGANTDQAYNGWGGKSLYTFNSSGAVTAGGTPAAVKATWDRPYDRDGSGTNLLSWELNMARWLEANGFDVAYAADVDVHRDPRFAARARAVIQVGHSEYWSKEMRDHLEETSTLGKGLGFFTGDTGSWAVRFEDSSLGSNRVLVCYRRAELDPLTATEPSRATVQWLQPPLNRPTQSFFGIGSNGLVSRSADWIAAGVATAPDLFADTGFKPGDVVKNLVGYEYDGLWAPGAGPSLPAGLTVLGRAPVIPASPLETQRQFGVSYDWPAAVPLGHLSTTVATLQPGPSWTLMVHVVSAERQVFLQYETEDGSTYQYKIGQTTYAIIPLAADFSEIGSRPLKRDLVADYQTSFGKVPGDARVNEIVVRGSLALGPLSITAPNGTVHQTSQEIGPDKAANAWYIFDGKGTLGLQTTNGTANPTVLMQATLPTTRPPDESDTVVIKRAGAGPVIAVGTMQWSWALDSVGDHVDHQGNETKVDPRIQALTGNMLRRLIASGR
ncbi:MAG TPA: N,N-dimethylformamidase beta subunit family domain-containing protein [Chloroflexota bacterium]|nr:N,N-dimethylformamidase beta subunit family domain-containing protein [Chloroflexota bacterium]